MEDPGVAANCFIELLQVKEANDYQLVGAYLLAEFIGIMRRAFTKKG